jgi:hypothetical protein
MVCTNQYGEKREGEGAHAVGNVQHDQLPVCSASRLHQCLPATEKYRARRPIVAESARSLGFESPNVGGVWRARPRFKERSMCRVIGHVHVRCLDAASDGGVTAIFPV